MKPQDRCLPHEKLAERFGLDTKQRIGFFFHDKSSVLPLTSTKSVFLFAIQSLKGLCNNCQEGFCKTRAGAECKVIYTLRGERAISKLFNEKKGGDF